MDTKQVLTVEEIDGIADKYSHNICCELCYEYGIQESDVDKFARAIEKAVLSKLGQAAGNC